MEYSRLSHDNVQVQVLGGREIQKEGGGEREREREIMSKR